MRKKSPNRGFTAVEVMISIAIVVILGAIVVSSFSNARTTKTLDVITDGLVATLEAARADALAGKGSGSFGVAFASSSYSYFIGASYSESDPSNKITELPSGWSLSTTTGNGASEILFSRISGAAQTTATVTVTNIAVPSLSRSISIGGSGEISVVR